MSSLLFGHESDQTGPTHSPSTSSIASTLSFHTVASSPSSSSATVSTGSVSQDTTPAVRILVAGDTGTGKTSLVHYLCHDEVLEGAKCTIGCSTDVKMYTYKATNEDYFLEFYDIGGHRAYEDSREMFIDKLHGILFVFDVANKNSYDNLKMWILEVDKVCRAKEAEGRSVHVQFSHSSRRPPQSATAAEDWSSPSFRAPNSAFVSSSSPLTNVSLSDQEVDQFPAPSILPISPFASSISHVPMIVVANKMDLKISMERLFDATMDFGIPTIQISAIDQMCENCRPKSSAISLLTSVFNPLRSCFAKPAQSASSILPLSSVEVQFETPTGNARASSCCSRGNEIGKEQLEGFFENVIARQKRDNCHV